MKNYINLNKIKKNQKIKPRIQGEETITTSKIVNVLEHINHPLDRIIGNLHDPPKTRYQSKMFKK